MHQIIYVIFIVCFSLTISAWDIAVAVEDEIHFLNSSGHVMAQISEEMKHMRALAYDPQLQHIYFSDIGDQSKFSVLKMTIPQPVTESSNKQIVIHPLVTKQESKVQGVAFDHLTHILYWTTGNGSSIKWLKIGESNHQLQPGNILHKFSEEVPIGIAVDSCRRYLYWTNCNLSKPSIERSSLDGSNREVIVYMDLFQPQGITIDQGRRRIYWTDVREGFDFALESAGLNGEDRKLIIRSTHQHPFALAISGNSIFWTDWTNDAVWQLTLDETQDSVPIKIRDFKSKTPTGIVSSSQHIADSSQCKPVEDMSQLQSDGPLYGTVESGSEVIQPPKKNVQAETSAYCLYRGIEKNSTTTTRECECLPGYSGEHCETFVCHNYCMHGGCSVDGSGNPKCECEQGRTGDRCETDTCENYCLNGGRCYKQLSSNSAAVPKCECAHGYEGDRCEQTTGDNVRQLCDRYCSHFVINPETADLELSELCRCQNAGDELSNVSVTVAHVIDGRSSCIWRDLNDSIRTILALACLVLIVVVVVLVRMVCQLRRRPRIKKRIIVNKSVTPLTSRPQPDQCEITIENCCNMNICETPCFEPEFRTPHATLRSGGKKEEKKNLLTSIELPPDDLY